MKTKKREIEVEAPTIEEAIKTAVNLLKVDKEEISIKVLREEKKGLFGMEGAEPAKIRATIKISKQSAK